jgi:tetrapyrrole methylase family protein/MazG family protein
MTITILGLGPGDPAHLTCEAWDLLSRSDEVYLRTSRHPTVAALPKHLVLHSFDDLYESLESFEIVYDTIAARILALGRRHDGVLYAVPGHPRMGESSVTRILDRAQEEGLVVRLVEGLSFLGPTLSLLGLDGLGSLQIVDGVDLAAAHHPPFDPDHPVLIGQVYGQRLAGDIKLTLMNAYPDDHPVTMVQAAGTQDASLTAVPLYKLDRSQPVNHLTSVYVPPLPHVSGLAALQETVARLRAPGGCPWDQEQTHQSLRSSLLEEAYEVLAALDAEDVYQDSKLCEELGDLLMQIVMHVQIATEQGAFRFGDVIGHIDAKLKRRHPHVFDNLHVQDSKEVLRNWEAIKATERAAEGNAYHSRLDSVPAILPALARAQALGDRAARTGFDWPDIEGVLEKVWEEATELKLAEDSQSQEQELGDLLFSLVNLARWLEIDAEGALRETCNRFVRRFAAMERAASSRGVDLAELSLAEQDALWDETKLGE